MCILSGLRALRRITMVFCYPCKFKLTLWQYSESICSSKALFCGSRWVSWMLSSSLSGPEVCLFWIIIYSYILKSCEFSLYNYAAVDLMCDIKLQWEILTDLSKLLRFAQYLRICVSSNIYVHSYRNVR